MEDHAVAVLGIGENAPSAERGCRIALILAHNNLKAAVTASAVMAKLTQGPQSITLAITTIAKSGQNDLPNTRAASEKNAGDDNVRDRRVMVCSFSF